jgi:Glycosyl transferase family 2
MATWSLVATVKAPEAKVLAFIAHHLSLGAQHIWLYFDDPDDTAHAAVAGHPRITATLCTADHWSAMGSRHDRHQNRQSRNARHTYELCDSDWMGHIDVDEFILPDRAVADILDTAPANDLLVRMEPFEAMHDPDLPDDIYTARLFRGAIRHEFWPLRSGALGDYRMLIRDGMLSHTVGKVFFRTGVRGLRPRLHSGLLNKTRIAVPDFHPEMRLLHFHAQDRQAWLDAVPFRITRGAYQYKALLQAYLAGASTEEITAFYRRTQTMPPEIAATMLEVGRAVTADLGLGAKVAAFKDGTLP